MALDRLKLVERIVADASERRWADLQDRWAAITADAPADGRVAARLRIAAERAEAHGSRAAHDVAARIRALAIAEWEGVDLPDRAEQEAEAVRRSGGPLPLGPLLLDHLLGRGAHGEVWAGRHGPAEIPVAVKVIRGLRQSARAALDNELRAVARLDHPGIVRLIDSGTVDTAAARIRPEWPEDSPVLVLEWARGGTLERRLATTPWPTARSILVQVLRGLAHAHARGLLHLDIKPANILLDGPRKRPEARIVDFGISVLQRDAPSGGRIRGTPAFMSPEQITGQGWRLSPASDIYALGALTVALIQGTPPFLTDDVMNLRQMHLAAPVPPLKPAVPVPANLDAWVRRAMAKDPGDRFASAAQAARALGDLGGELVVDEVVRVRTPPTSTEDATLVVEGGSGPVTTAPEDDAGPVLPLPEPRVPASWKPPGRARAVRPLLDQTLGLFELREAGLVGRERERTLLWTALEQAWEQQTPAVVVAEAPVGMGTSRLLGWLAERAVELGAATVLRIAGVPGETAEAPMIRLLAEQLGAQDATGPDLEERATATLHSAGLQDTEEIAALCAAVDGAWRDDHGLRLASRMVQRGARTGPVLLIVDDAQWAGLALRWVLELSDGLLPLLAVVGVSSQPAPDRPEAAWLGALVDDASVVRLTLPPLDRPALHALARGLIPLDAVLQEHLVTRCGGHPGTLVDLLADAIGRGALVRADRGFELREGAELSDAASADQAVEERVRTALASATDEALRAGLVAAALGPSVLRDRWATACAACGTPADGSALAALAGAHLLKEHPDRWVFERPAVRHQLTSNADPALFLGVARSLEGVPGAEERRGHLLIDAGHPAEGAAAYLSAAGAHEEGGRWESALAALDHYDDALCTLGARDADPRWAKGWIRRAGVFLARRDVDRAAPVLDQLESGLHQHTAWVDFEGDIRLRRADHTFWSGDTASWVRQLRGVLAWFETRGDDRSVALTLHRLGVAARMAGDLDEATRALERALDLRGPTTPPHTIQQSLAHVYRLRGQDARARALFERLAIDGPPFSRVDAMSSLAGMDMAKDEIERALSWLEQAIRTADAVGDMRLTPRVQLLEALCRLDRWEEASARLADALPLARVAPPTLTVRLHALRVALDAGTPDETEFAHHLAALDTDLSAASGLGSVEGLLRLAADRATALGRSDRAEVLLRRMR